MNISVLLGKKSFGENLELGKMLDRIRSAGHVCNVIGREDSLEDGCDLLLSVGGDGTFLVAASMAAPLGVPVLGVNLGHLGFLSENTPQSVADAILSGDWTIDVRLMLNVRFSERNFLALNDVVISREGSSMLGVKVTVDGKCLPVCWADGVLVSTPSGSTAYSLSVGGPIVMPTSRILVIAPIAPHNLNTRPLIVPAESRIDIEFISRDRQIRLSADNKFAVIPSNSSIHVEVAQFSLKRVCLKSSSFIRALSDKLFLGEDKRNEK